MKEIRVLDCTLRDGGYCNDCQFGFENTKFIIDSLLRSGVDIIECGFLTQKVAYKQGVTRFNTLEQVKEVLPQDRQGKTFVILMDYGACDVETIPDWDGSSVDGILPQKGHAARSGAVPPLEGKGVQDLSAAHGGPALHRRGVPGAHPPGQ